MTATSEKGIAASVGKHSSMKLHADERKPLPRNCVSKRRKLLHDSDSDASANDSDSDSDHDKNVVDDENDGEDDDSHSSESTVKLAQVLQTDSSQIPSKNTNFARGTEDLIIGLSGFDPVSERPTLLEALKGLQKNCPLLISSSDRQSGSTSSSSCSGLQSRVVVDETNGDSGNDCVNCVVANGQTAKWV
ncbi:unnamed protein product [Sphagnum jensenii]